MSTSSVLPICPAFDHENYHHESPSPVDGFSVDDICEGSEVQLTRRSSLSSFSDQNRPQDSFLETNSVFSLRKFFSIFGPGFLISVAYIDPGNYYADVQSGTNFEYSQLWIIFWCTCFSFLISLICVRVTFHTNRSLATLIRQYYPKYITWSMWMLMEVVVIATDIPEVIGFGWAFQIFFGWPTYAGIILSIVPTFIFLLASHFRFRYLELIVVAFVGALGIMLVVELALTKPDPAKLFYGWWVPSIWSGSLFAAIGILGAIIMPHNLFLQTSSLLIRIKEDLIPNSHQIYFLWEPFFPLIITFLVNMSVTSIAAKTIFPQTCPTGTTNTSPRGGCSPGTDPLFTPLDSNSIGLFNFCEYLTFSGGCVVWGFSLLAAAQVSTITATLTGQAVMEDFVQMRAPLWIRSLISRMCAILPAIIVSTVASSNSRLNDVIGIVNTTLGVMLPIALTPLVRFASHPKVMSGKPIHQVLRAIAAAFIVFVTVYNTISFVIPDGEMFARYTNYEEGGNFVFAVQMNIVQDVVVFLYLTLLVVLAFWPLNNKLFSNSNSNNNSNSCLPCHDQQDQVEEKRN